MLNKRGPAPTKADAKVMGEIYGQAIKNTSYTGFDYQNNLYQDDDYARERDRAINHNSRDGIYPMTPEEQAAEREVNMALLKKFTRSILSMNLTNFSFPVSYSEPRSFLERTADLFNFLATKYIDLANAEQDNDKRLIYIATGIAAGYHLYMACKKPWNPVLGETYVGEYENGAIIYGEQTSHHPPISDFEIYGKDNKWKCTGHCHFSIASGIREFDINQNGIFHLTLSDGTEYEWEFPVIQVFGIIYGDRIIRVKGPVIIKDLTHNLICRVECWPKKDAKKGINEYSSSTTYGFTYEGDDSKQKPRKEFVGDYARSFAMGDEVLWDINTDIIKRPKVEPPEDLLLLSDSRYRLDRALLIRNEIDEADKAKVIVEESQRREEKLRIRVDA